MSAPLNGCMCQMGECESCNRVVEAWEAMRETLRGPITGDSIASYGERCAAALTLAEAVSKVTRP